MTKRISRTLFALTACAAGLWPASARAAIETRSCEMRVDPSWSAATIRSNVDGLANAGYNCIRVETFYHGGTLYPSAVMAKWGLPTTHSGFASNSTSFSTLLSEAHAKGMKVYGWVESFYVWNSSLGTANPILTKYPDWAVRNTDGTMLPKNAEQTYYFMSPANLQARQFLTELYAEVAKTGVDGMLFDYLRYPRQSLGPANPLSFDTASKTRAQTELGLDITQIPLDLTNPDFYTWTLWRQKQTTDAAKALAAAVRAANPNVVICASLHPAYNPDWKTHDSLRDWPAWWPDIKVLSMQYYESASSSESEIQTDEAAANPQALMWPNILESDIAAGSPLLTYVRTQPMLGISHWVYSSLTPTDLSTLKSGPFAQPAIPAETAPAANAAALIQSRVASLTGTDQINAQAALGDIQGVPTWPAMAGTRLAAVLSDRHLASLVKRDLNLAYRLTTLMPATQVSTSDVDGDGATTVLDVSRTLGAFLQTGAPIAPDAADLNNDNAVTTQDAALILVKGLGLS